MLGLLPQIESKDGKARPYSYSRGALGQHSTQREPALEQADPSFDAATKPLQLSEPSAALMSCFKLTEPANLRNTESTDSQPTKLVHIVGAVIAAIGGQRSGRSLENLLGLANKRHKLGLVAGIAPMNLVVNDHPRVVLDQLQGATKLDRLVELAFHDGSSLGIEKRHDPLWDGTVPRKFVLGLLNQLFSQLDCFAKPLLELGGYRG